ncbi:MAG: DUF371 domain-containing protein [Nitrososphaerota archaeon]|jgi:hypothetical protein|nr:DUF371 domain-containing protein [Nitrososphaerota archaeon]MDG7009404.1 DUF371 domain-containing protein [Nitrososphaerota archaeon]MDG7019176.1 DUF371 domain-containing protein [Nitrososphaerota archaeon]MDG7026824.1 DUF371 domain-containing protein [Nitrososphaerota archaeon]
MKVYERAAADPRKPKDVVTFRGHPKVLSEHPTTIEVTTEGHLSERGDCIVGVSADKGCLGLNPEVKQGLRKTGTPVSVRIVVGGLSYLVAAQGDSRLKLTDPQDIVIRKSDFVSERTLALRADSSARDLPREMIRALRDPETKGRLEIEVG